MRIVAMSDSHGSKAALEKVFDKTAGSGDIFVHLGDGQWEIEFMQMIYPELDIRHVAGNCDWSSSSPKSMIIEAEGIKILCTHGHLYGINYGIDELCRNAKENGCTAVLFGHTHCRCQRYEDGIYLLNPGSCASPRDSKPPSFGWIDITEAGIFTNIADL